MLSRSIYNPFSSLKYNRYNNYRFAPNTAFTPPTMNQKNSYNNNVKNTVENNINNKIDIYGLGYVTEPLNTNSTEENLNINPLYNDNNTMSIFGLPFAIDDLIIIGLAIFLIMEDSCDYMFIIILALILFDFKLSSFADIGFIRKLGIFN
ncbi:MAG: hypothetical protein N2749_06130 [Clostridia bacterium]|nr:hypothetical protein [Clostridia bacterium]